MAVSKHSFALQRTTRFCDLAFNVKRILNRLLVPLAVVLAIEVAYLSFTAKPGVEAFAMISIGTWVVMAFWSKKGIGLPLLPMIGLQTLIIYGLPIALGNSVLFSYSKDYLTKAGLEVLIFSLALVGSWQLTMQVAARSKPISYAVEMFDREGVKGLGRLGFILLGISTGYEVLKSLNQLNFIFDVIPQGSYPIIVALANASAACGFFIVAMAVGSGRMSPVAKSSFWMLLALNSLISASSFLLSAAALNIMAAAIGLFWGSGRMPWRYLTVMALALCFLNIGKFTMRGRYWGTEESGAVADFSLAELPGYYVEWIEASYAAIKSPMDAPLSSFDEKPGESKAYNQSLLDRVDNLQNLLFVINAIDNFHLRPLDGATYKLIPALLIPRILWPDKPRSHEGQVLLNVHFGRQDFESTLDTYVAWGLLPEAYGNFGPAIGAIVIGVVLGIFIGWTENFTSQKLVISLEGFIAFDLFLNLLNSYEMVASVLVTSTFQSVMPIAIACAPFVRRKRNDPQPAKKT